MQESHLKLLENQKIRKIKYLKHYTSSNVVYSLSIFNGCYNVAQWYA